MNDYKIVKASEIFGFECNIEVPFFLERNNFVPEIDPNYCFDPATTKAILAGFAYNLRVMVQGLHGTGKSTHIEQVAAKLNWPVLRVNLDGYISRSDFIGRDAIIVRDGMQITEFQEGVIPWSLKQNIALILDEYDAATPNVMFVLQRLLENNGKFTLLDKNQVLVPHNFFRIFATTNTIGMGDNTGLYQGTNIMNQGQLDRWNVVTSLNYLEAEKEQEIILGKVKGYDDKLEIIKSMVELAGLIRSSFKQGDIASVMSPRTVINWAENNHIFNSIADAFKLTYLNKCDDNDKAVIAELYQRVFNQELTY